MDIENNQPPEEQNKSGVKKYAIIIFDFVKLAIIALIIVMPIRYFLFQPFIVSGASMAPNFSTGDYLIIDEISYRLSQPQRGDVIVFNAGFVPGYSGQKFIKRIVGLPGETVEVNNGKVSISKDETGYVLEEKYLPENRKTVGDIKITLQGNQYFVMGDNRDFSFDSRAWGILPKTNIIGKAAIRLFPFNNISVFFANKN